MSPQFASYCVPFPITTFARRKKVLGKTNVTGSGRCDAASIWKETSREVKRILLPIMGSALGTKKAFIRH